MSIFEYDEEKELELYRRAERAVGEENGYKVGLEDGEERGIEKGIEKGETLFAQLADRLFKDDRDEDFRKAVKDKTFRDKLYQEYKIQK